MIFIALGSGKLKLKALTTCCLAEATSYTYAVSQYPHRSQEGAFGVVFKNLFWEINFDFM